MNKDSVVIIGAGQAGFQVAHSLRQASYEGRITLIGNEKYLPYQRPPLSKAFLQGKMDDEGILLRQEDFYSKNTIDLMIGQHAENIDRLEKSVQLCTGSTLHYTHLVLATGASVRRLNIAGSDLDGVVYVRSLGDAKSLKIRMERAHNIVVIGAGFIGLEFAAVAAKLGKKITVVESQPRLMERAVAPIISHFFKQQHENHGVNFLLNAQVKNIAGEKGTVKFIELEDGQIILADMVVVGVGVVPNDQIAREAGLTCSNGIDVDTDLRTSDADIFAVGDCAYAHNIFAKVKMRVESVQNAVDQGKHVASRIMGDESPNKAVPWFWSDQYDFKLQMVGINTGYETTILRGNVENCKFSVFYYKKGGLVGIDTVNNGVDHMLGRKLIGQGLSVPPEAAADETVNLKIYLA